MSLLRKLNKILLIQSVLGLFPYKINKRNDKIEHCLLLWFYSFLLFCTVAITLAYIETVYVLKDGIIVMFRDIATACTFGNFLCLKLIYNCCAIDILYNRKKYSMFLNMLNSVDRTLKPVDKLEIKKLFGLHIVILVSNFVIYFVFNLSVYSVPSLIWSICNGIQVIAITLKTFFIKAIASIISNRMEIVVSMLNEIPLNDLKNNIVTIAEGVQTFSKLTYCKERMSKVFGLQLFFTFFFDFTVISILMYPLLLSVQSFSNTTELSKSLWSIIGQFSLFILPHIVKDILLVHEMDKLGQKVRRFSYVVTMQTNRVPQTTLVALIFDFLVEL